jgi:hypothetical protein
MIQIVTGRMAIRKEYDIILLSKYPPEPGALLYEPLKAAGAGSLTRPQFD